MWCKGERNRDTVSPAISSSSHSVQTGSNSVNQSLDVHSFSIKMSDRGNSANITTVDNSSLSLSWQHCCTYPPTANSVLPRFPTDSSINKCSASVTKMARMMPTSHHSCQNGGEAEQFKVPRCSTTFIWKTTEILGQNVDKKRYNVVFCNTRNINE